MVVHKRMMRNIIGIVIFLFTIPSVPMNKPGTFLKQAVSLCSQAHAKRRFNRKSKKRRARRPEKKSRDRQQQQITQSTSSLRQMPPPMPSTKDVYLGVLPVQSLGASSESIKKLEKQVIRELEELQSYKIVSSKTVAKRLKKYNKTTVCQGNLLCAAEAGRFAAVHKIIEVILVSMGEVQNASLRLVDVATARELAKVSQQLPQIDEEWPYLFRKLIVQLLEPQNYIGALQLACSQDGADVFLDDNYVGKTPIAEPIAGLKAGPHVLRISKAGFLDFNNFVHVAFNRTQILEVNLGDNSYTQNIVASKITSSFTQFYLVAMQDKIEVRVDGEPIAFTPLTSPVEYLAAGEHRLSLYKEGQDPVTVSFVIEAGQRTTIEVLADEKGIMQVQPAYQTDVNQPMPGSEVDLEALRVMAAWQGPQFSYHPTYLSLVGFGTGGLGAVIAFGMGSYFGVKMKQAEDEYDQLIQNGGSYQELIAIQNQGTTNEQRANVSFVAGTAIMIVGGGILLYDLLFNPATWRQDTWVYGETPLLSGVHQVEKKNNKVSAKTWLPSFQGIPPFAACLTWQF